MKLCVRLQALCSVVFCKLWDICPCIAHVGAPALCTEISVSSVLQGDFLQKHRALLGWWGFVGGSIPEDSISPVYCVWWRLSTVFPRGRSSVYDYKLYKLCVLLCFVNYGTYVLVLLM